MTWGRDATVSDTGSTAPARPEPSGREYITVEDFSPGIYGDMHASTTTRATADTATMRGMFPVNGAARIEGTDRCHADKTGALVPLPKAQLTGLRDGQGPSFALQTNRPYRYVLDAQLGQSLVDTSLTASTPNTTIRQPLQIQWGFWGDDTTTWRACSIGREYRPWFAHPYHPESMLDFQVCEAAGETTSVVRPLPIGQLCDGRFYVGNTEYGLEDTSYILLPGTAGNYLETPDTADLSFLTDVTLIVAVELTSFGDQMFISKSNVNPQLGYQFWISGGRLTFTWSSNGTSANTLQSSVLISSVTELSTISTIAPKFAWFAVGFDADNGAAGRTARFWYSLTDTTDLNAVTWTQLGANVTTATASSIFDSTAPFRIGADNVGNNPVTGKLYSVWASNGFTAAPPLEAGGINRFRMTPQNFPPDEPTSFKIDVNGFIGGPAINVVRAGAPSLSIIVPSLPFRPSWMYPVSVALAATPWYDWGAGNLMKNGAISMATRYELGVAPEFTTPVAFYAPSIGISAKGTNSIGMGWHNTEIGALPQSTKASDWYFHYGDRELATTIEAIEAGPINPYLMVAHQGRILIADRRRTRKAMNITGEPKSYGFADDLLWYSDYALPCQNPMMVPLTSDGPTLREGGLIAPIGDEPNSAYSTYPRASMSNYNNLLVAEDDVSEIGTIGVVSVDQVMVIKHRYGGAIISGDLDSPTVRRLPYIEPTGGVVCKGAQTPIGFVYGSINGIYVWQGGDTTTELSPQIDGFFWDHTNGTAEEQYAGSRGRMTYWNGLVCVPNNFVYDTDRQSWWRFKITDLLPVDAGIAPYNCYDRDGDGLLYAFPYRNKWPTTVSKVTWPSSSTNINQLTIPDSATFSAPTQLDIRVAVADVATGAAIRALASHYDTSGNQRSWWFGLDASDNLVFRMSSNGSADTTATSSVVATALNTPVLLRVTWDSTVASPNVKFWTKTLTTGMPESAIAAALRANSEWVQLGTTQAGLVAALFNSTSVFRVGNTGAAFSEPITGRFYGVEVRTALLPETSVDAPVIAIIPTDLPSNVAVASSFVCSTGQTVTITKAGVGNAMVPSYVDPPVPLWHTFDQRTLDNEYNWHSHPLVETRARIMSFQEIQLVVTGKSDAGHVSTPATIDVTLSGFDERGAAVTPVTTTFTLANTVEPQVMRKDVAANFQAQYVSMKIHALDPISTLPAPKIHQLRLGVKDRAQNRRTP